MKICVCLLVIASALASGQRITTIQLDGVQYFISRMNPYSPELNYFLAYQYCRSLGLQLASFETKEKADTLTEYLRNAGYTKYDFWTSGNKLGTDMFLWMSSGLPFNVTFDYMRSRPGNRAADVPPGTEPQRVARESGDSGSADACVAMVAPTLAWQAENCIDVKDFICEQTRCYYYNYGSISVSATQGSMRPYLTTTAAPRDDTDEDHVTNNKDNGNTEVASESGETTKEKEENERSEDEEDASSFDESHSDVNALETSEKEAEGGSTGSSTNESKKLQDPIVGRLMTSAVNSGVKTDVTAPILSTSRDNHENAKAEISAEESRKQTTLKHDENEKDREVSIEAAKSTRPDDIPDITSLFTDGPIVKSRKETAFDGLETHEIRSALRSNAHGKLEHRESADIVDIVSGLVGNAESDVINSELDENHTIGPYDSVQEDYVNDQTEDGNAERERASLAASLDIGAPIVSGVNKEQQDEDSSTFLPEAEPDYRYNMKWRSMGKVLDPPSK